MRQRTRRDVIAEEMGNYSYPDCPAGLGLCCKPGGTCDMEHHPYGCGYADADQIVVQYGPCHLCGSETPKRHGDILMGNCDCGAHTIEVCYVCAADPPPCPYVELGFRAAVER